MAAVFLDITAQHPAYLIGSELMLMKATINQPMFLP